MWGDRLPWSGTPAEGHLSCGPKEEGGKGPECSSQRLAGTQLPDKKEPVWD